MLEELMKKAVQEMNEDDKHAEELMEKEAKEPQHNGGNESLSQWAKEEEAEPEHAKSTADNSILEWAKEEDAEPEFGLVDGQITICGKPIGEPDALVKKIQDLQKAGSVANNASGDGIQVSVVSTDESDDEEPEIEVD